MPLTLTLTEGVLPKGQEKLAFSRLSEAMLKWHGMTGNKTMTDNVIGSLHVLPKDHTFNEATHIIHEMSGGKQAKEHIFINVVHAVDGAWNFNGQAMTNAEIGAAVSKG
jgi:hypothetical protein